MNSEGTAERVLRLLGLLQTRRSWTAAELAAELGVTDRSIRRDIDRLRALGYPVHAAPGAGGGYRLGTGTRLPPLLLDDDEAIATAVSLRLATGGTIAGAGEAALRALAKLDRLMPPRLRAEVKTIHNATETLMGTEPAIDAEVLVTLARACRDTVRVTFDYIGYNKRDHAARQRERTVEPVRMVATRRHWYLMAYDLDRSDWRTFRLDRMRHVTATNRRFPPREHPDPVDYIQEAVTAAPYRHVARIRLRASTDEVTALVPPHVGRVDADHDGWCILTTGADDLDWVAMHVARLGFETQILDPPELRGAVARLARNVTAMVENL